MKSVAYVTNQCMPCSCNAAVIMCVPDTITANAAPFIEGTLSYVDQQLSVYGCNQYVYSLLYDERQLVDPTHDLLACEISGLVCRGCLTSYIDYKFSTLAFPFSIPEGSDISYVFPGTAGEVGQVLMIVDVTGTVITLGWDWPV